MEQNKIRIYLCDDNQKFIEEIISKIFKIIKNNNRECEITAFTRGRDLLKQWNKEFADVVFLDIDMPEVNGFEVAAQLQKNKEDALILFVTSHEDKVYQSYDYHPFWFIRKSHMNDLNVVFPKLLRKIDAMNENKKLVFNLQADTMTIELDINTLIFIESVKNNILIKDRIKDDIQIRCKISAAEEQLYPLHIIRVQNGVLINCRYISKITSREVILTDGTRFNLSRFRVDYAKDEYQRFVRSKRL